MYLRWIFTLHILVHKICICVGICHVRINACVKIINIIHTYNVLKNIIFLLFLFIWLMVVSGFSFYFEYCYMENGTYVVDGRIFRNIENIISVSFLVAIGKHTHTFTYNLSYHILFEQKTLFILLYRLFANSKNGIWGSLSCTCVLLKMEIGTIFLALIFNKLSKENCFAIFQLQKVYDQHNLFIYLCVHTYMYRIYEQAIVFLFYLPLHRVT